MNILYLCGSYGLDLDKMLGPKIHVQSILSGLKKNGHKPILVAVQKQNSLPSFKKFEHYIIKHSYLKGYIHRIIPYTSFLDSLRVFLKIWGIHKKSPIDIIHERYTGLSWGGILASKLIGIPLLIEMNGPGIEEKKIQGTSISLSRKWILIKNQLALIRQTSSLILASEAIADFIYKKRNWKLPKYPVLLNCANDIKIDTGKATRIRKKLNFDNHINFRRWG